MRVVGMDLSLTAAGFCDASSPYTLKTDHLRGCERIATIRDHVLGFVRANDDPLVMLEGYSFASKGTAVINLGELGGVVRLALHEAGITVVEVAPSALKLFGTGKGNANKVAMGMAAQRNGYTGPEDDNAIDAWWLRQFGLYGTPEGPATTEYRTRAFDKVEWPT